MQEKIPHKAVGTCFESTNRQVIFMINALRNCLFFRRLWRSEYPEPVVTRSLFKDFFVIHRAMKQNQSPLDRGEPWLSLAAIDELRNIVQPSARVLEYGSGGSTVFFAKHCHSVLTIEHDQQWHDLLKEKLSQLNIDNVNLQHVGPEACTDLSEIDPHAGFGSTGQEFADMSFKAYVQAPSAFSTQKFDIISIDGRARPACIRQSLDMLAPGGVLIVDNAERQHYAKVLGRQPWCDWKTIKAAGPNICQWGWSMTQFVHCPKQ